MGREPTRARQRPGAPRRGVLTGAGLAAASVLLLFVAGELAVRAGLLPQPRRPALEGSAAAGDRQEVTGIPDAALYVRTEGGLALRPHARVWVRGHDVSGRDVEIRSNALGFRGPELGPKEPGVLRVVVLGDSVTFGDYVDEEETYPAQLERVLRERAAARPSAPRVQVLNGGVGSIGVDEMLPLLAGPTLAAQPDLVLVGLYLNDAEPSLFLPPADPRDPLRRSHLLAMVSDRVALLRLRRAHDRRMAARTPAYRALAERFAEAESGSWQEGGGGFEREVLAAFGDWGYAWSEQAWQEMGRGLAALLRVSRAHGVPLAVALHPVRHQVEARALRNEPQLAFARSVERLAIPAFDLLPGLRAIHAAGSRPLYYDHCHYTPEGQRRVAELLAPFVEAHLGAGGGGGPPGWGSPVGR